MAALALISNPRKRATKRKTAKRKSPARRLATVKTVSTRRYRRNPSPRVNNAIETIKDGAIGAAGAVATEVILSKLPLPANFQSGPARTAVSALGAVGVGMLVSKFGDKKMGKTMAQGGVTVAMHSTLRGMVAGPMGLSGADDLMGYGDDLMGMGYYSPAPVYGEVDDMGAMFSDHEDDIDADFNF